MAARVDRAPHPMGTYFQQRDLERLRALRGVLLAMEARPEGEEAPRYWSSRRDIELYDQIFAARIGWKWDAVLDELVLRHGVPAAETLLDWGTGTGIATRRVLAHVPGIRRVVLYDRDPEVLGFALERLGAEYPDVEVEAARAAPDGPFDLAIASHVLDELDEHGESALVGALRGAREVLWVEPGSKRTARRLSAARDGLLDAYEVLAPCVHSGACGMLAEGQSRHWCHLFARPPAEVHTTGSWSEIHRELKIDLRSLPYSYVALRRRADGARAARITEGAAGARLLGRPRFQRGRVLLDLCDSDGVREAPMLQRTDKALFKSLKSTAGEAVLLREEDGRFERLPAGS